MNKKIETSPFPVDFYFILKGKRAFKCAIEEWVKWNLDNPKGRRVALTTIGDIKISTVFLGLNYTPWLKKTPLFETMVFGGKLNLERDRYSTWAQAKAGHRKMVKRVKEALNGLKK